VFICRCVQVADRVSDSVATRTDRHLFDCQALAGGSIRQAVAVADNVHQARVQFPSRMPHLPCKCPTLQCSRAQHWFVDHTKDQHCLGEPQQCLMYPAMWQQQSQDGCSCKCSSNMHTDKRHVSTTPCITASARLHNGTLHAHLWVESSAETPKSRPRRATAARRTTRSTPASGLPIAPAANIGNRTKARQGSWVRSNDVVI
jgi:hypothetical protein